MARPEQNADGSANLMKWKCVIPGKDGTDWAGGFYPVTMEFSSDYPAKAPKVSLPKGFFHPNIYPSGKVCLSILNEETQPSGEWYAPCSCQQAQIMNRVVTSLASVTNPMMTKRMPSLPRLWMRLAPVSL